MSLGLITLILLVLTIAIGFKTGVNTGLLALSIAFIFCYFLTPKTVSLAKSFEDQSGIKIAKLGTADYEYTEADYKAAYEEFAKTEEMQKAVPGMKAKEFKTLVTSFPKTGSIKGSLQKIWNTSLFLTVLGITLLFAVAKVNKTLDIIASKATALSGGKTKLIPIIFFVFATILSAVGPGNIAVCALVLPIALKVANEDGINPLLMAGSVISGSNAGGLSPLTPTGIVAKNLSKGIYDSLVGYGYSLPNVTNGDEFGAYVNNNIMYVMLIAQIFIVACFYIIFKGYKIPDKPKGTEVKTEKLNSQQSLTLGVIGVVVLSVVLFKVDVGFAGFTGATVLLLCKAADQGKVIAGAPWSTLIMICGIGVLIGVVDMTGGITLLSEGLQAIMTPKIAAMIFAILGGLLSLVSSASGVVMPTLFATVPDIYNNYNLAGTPVNPVTLLVAITLGAHFVTCSPVSTLGGLAMASADDSIDKNKFFVGLFGLGLGGLALGAVFVFIYSQIV